MQKNILIQLQNARIYQGENMVLDDVNMTISQGEFSYLIGKTGSGKSSLLKTLYGALPLKKGVGNVCGFDITALSRRTIPLLRRKLGIVFKILTCLTTEMWKITYFLCSKQRVGRVKQK